MESTNHVGSPYDSHQPWCPDASTCPHCGAPKARAYPYVGYPYYPWIQRYYPPQYNTGVGTVYTTNNAGS